MKKIRYFMFSIMILLIGSIYGYDSAKAYMTVSTDSSGKKLQGYCKYKGGTMNTEDLEFNSKYPNVTATLYLYDDNTISIALSACTNDIMGTESGNCSAGAIANANINDFKKIDDCPKEIYYHHLNFGDYDNNIDSSDYKKCPNTWNESANRLCPGENFDYVETFILNDSQSYVTNPGVDTTDRLDCSYDNDLNLIKNPGSTTNISLNVSQNNYGIATFKPYVNSSCGKPNEHIDKSLYLKECPAKFYCNDKIMCKNPGWSTEPCDKYNQNTENNTGTEFSGKLIDEKTQEIIDWVLNPIRIVGIILMIILGMLDFIKAAASGNEEQVNKSKTSFIKRLIACVILFLLPFIVDLLIWIVNTANGSHVIESANN